LGIDDAAVDMLGLKLLIRLKAIDSVLQGVKVPDSFLDGYPD
jgi:hypothetical protein